MMTPEQQHALEFITGRGLTSDELAALDLLLPDRQDVQIAELLSIGRVKPVSTPIGIGSILSALNPDGGEFLNSLEAMGTGDANVKWTLKLIEQSNLDVGIPAYRDQMQSFAAAVPEMARGIAVLLALGERPDPIHYNTISEVLNVAEGRVML